MLASDYARAPQLTVAERLDFAAQPVGSTSAALSIAIGNAGHSPLNIQRLILAGTDPRDYLLDTANCTNAPIDPGGTCSLPVRFRPLAVGVRSAVITVTHEWRGDQQAVLLSGSGIPVSALDVRPARLRFRDQQVGATSLPAAVQISTDGINAVQIVPPVIEQSRPGAFQIASDGCSNPPAATRAGCTVEVLFTPYAEGAHTGTLVLRLGSGESRNVELQGQGTAVPDALRLNVNPKRIDFPLQRLRTVSRKQPLDLVNAGTGPLTVGKLAIEGPHQADFVRDGDGCSGKMLAVGARCTVEVGFAPTAEGPRTADLLVPSNASTVPVRVALNGSGREPPAVRALTTVAPVFTPQIAGSRGGLEKAILRSTGTAPVRIGASAIRQTGRAFGIAEDTCSNRSLLTEEACAISVWFRPREAGSHEAWLQVEHDAPDSPRQLVLQGTSPVTPKLPVLKRLAIVPNGIGFEPRPTVGRPAVGRRAADRVAGELQWLELQSAGTAPVEVGGISLSGKDPEDFRLDDRYGCANRTLRTVCRVAVLFAPTAPGQRVAELRFEHDAPGSLYAVALSGVGLDAPPGCPDPAVTLIPEIVERPTAYTGKVRLTGNVGNVGPVPYRSTTGPQSLVLYQTPAGGRQQSVAEAKFTSLAPGEEVRLTHEVEWNTSNEFPPSFTLALVYNANPNLDCGSGNNVAFLPPDAISQVLRSSPQSPSRLSAEDGVNRPGEDYKNVALDGGPGECQRACAAEGRCRAFTWVKPGVQGRRGVCWLKSKVPPAVSDPCCVSGYKGPTPDPQGAPRREVRPGTFDGKGVRLRQPVASLPATINISGDWKGKTGIVYRITQNGDQFTWDAPQLREQGRGKITGKEIDASWSGGAGSGTSPGEIVVDASGRAERIVWKNNAEFTR